MSSGESLHSSVEMASAREERPKLMWKPKPDRSTNIHEFQSLVNHAFGLNLGEYINFFRFALKISLGYSFVDYFNPHKILFFTVSVAVSGGPLMLCNSMHLVEV